MSIDSRGSGTGRPGWIGRLSLLMGLALASVLAIPRVAIAQAEVECPAGLRAGDGWRSCGFSSDPCPIPPGFDSVTAICDSSGPPGQALGRLIAGSHAVTASCTCTFRRISDGGTLVTTPTDSSAMHVAPDQPPVFDGTATLIINRGSDSNLPVQETRLLQAAGNTLEIELRDPETAFLVLDFSDPEGDGIVYSVREAGTSPEPPTDVPLPLGGGEYGVRHLSVTPISVQDGVAGEPVEVDVHFRVSVPIVRAIEVSQVIQTWRNEVLLVEDKDPTFVRVHLEHQGFGADDTVDERTTGALRLTRHPDSPPGMPEDLGFVFPIDLERKRVEATANAVRHDPTRSLLFRLPEESLHGRLEIRVELLDEPQYRCQEPPSTLESPLTPSDCGTIVEFAPAAPLPIRIVPVENRVGGPQSEFVGVPSADEIERARLRLLDILPVSRIPRLPAPVVRHFGDPDSGSGPRDVFGKLRKLRRSRGCGKGCPEIYLGLTPHTLRDSSASAISASAVFGDLLGLGALFLRDVAWARDAPAEAFDRNTAAHEVAHVLGRDHVAQAGTRYFEGDYQTFIQLGPCGAESSEFVVPWSHIEDADGDLDPEALIGPISSLNVVDEDDQVWGLRKLVDETSDRFAAAPAPVDPRVHFELMSYCADTDWDWISRRTYEQIHAELVARNAWAPPASGSSLLLIEGTLDFSTGVAAISNVEPIDSGRAPEDADPDGDFVVGLLDGSGAVLGFQNFDADLVVGQNERSRLGHFSVAVPFSPLIEEVAIVLDADPTTILASRSRSTSPPTVTLLSPNGGESFIDEPIDVQWLASDPDGDALHFDLQYSPDGGTTWEAVEVDLEGTAATIESASLRGSTSALFRVTANDGFRIGSDESDGVFSVSGQVPEIRSAAIALPTAIVYGIQRLPLRATAFDLEDGDLGGASLSWASDLDGTLGSGDAVDVLVSALTPGEHTILLEAADSSGNVATTTLPVTIVADPPSADLGIEVLGLPASVDVGDLEMGSVRVRNAGPDAVSKADIVFEASDGVEVRSAAGPASPCTLTLQRFTCPLGVIEVGEERIVEFEVESVLPGVAAFLASVRSELADDGEDDDVARPTWRARTTRADVNGDGNVDLADVLIVLDARDEQAGVDDDRDVDLDGTITGLDARRVVRECDRARCEAL